MKENDKQIHHYFLDNASYAEKFDDLQKRDGAVEKKIHDSGGYNTAVSNRFTDILCPKSTQLPGHETIHANKVTLDGLELILSQAPLPENEAAFWDAVSKNTNLIVDVTNKTDRIEKGVQRYFPHEIGASTNPQGSPEVHVHCKSQENYSTVKVHRYDVQVGNQSPKSISRIHFRGWPDHGAVKVEELRELVNRIRSKPTKQPLWIHCRAGVGRSGTVAVALALAKMKDENRLTAENYSKVIGDLIIEGREQRGTSFVQAESQYQLLHKFAQSLLRQ